MKLIVPLTIMSCAFLILAPSMQASKLSDWIDNHAVPRAPSANKVNGAADQTNATAADAQKTINRLALKLDTLCDVFIWGGGAVLGLLGLMLIGKNVKIWRQALSKGAQTRMKDQPASMRRHN